MTNNQAQIIQEILKERQRQDEKWGENRTFESIGLQTIKYHIGKHAGENVSQEVLALMGRRVMSEVLLEEAGEIARASLEGDMDQLEKELIQLGAVCVAMLEYLGREDSVDLFGSAHNPASESVPIDMGYTIGYRETKSESEGGFW